MSVLLDQLQLTASTVAGGQTVNPAVGASYDLFGVILTAEGAAEFRPDGALANPGCRAAAARYTSTLTDDWDLTLAAQYLYWANAGAATDPAARGIAHTKNAFFQIQLTGGTEFALATLVVRLEDDSVLHQTMVTWTPWDNVDFIATLQTASGGAGDAWQYVRDPLQPTLAYKYVASLAATYRF